MIRLLALMLMFSFCGQTRAQENEVLLRGESFKGKIMGDLCGARNGSHFVAMFPKAGFFNSHPDYHFVTYEGLSLERVNEVIIEQPRFGEAKAFYHSSYVDPKGNVVAYFTAYDRTGKYFVRSVIDKAGASDLVEVASISVQGRLDGIYDVAFSPDSAKVLMYAAGAPSRRELLQVSLRVEDQDRNMLWEQKLELPHAEGDFDIKNVAVSDAGKVFLLGYDDQAGNFSVFALKEDEELQQVVLPGDKHAMGGLQLTPDYENDRLAIFGVYSEERSFMDNDDQFSGVVAYLVDQQKLEVKASHTEEIYRITLEPFLDELAQGKELEDFEVLEAMRKPAGGAWLIAEERSVSGPDARQYVGRTVVISYNQEAQVDWVAVVPQAQSVIYGLGMYLSHIRFSTGNKLSFIMNAHEENTEDMLNYKGKKMMNPFDASVVLYELDEQGSLQRKELFSNDGYEAFAPQLGLPAGGQKVILYFRKASYQGLGLLKL